MRIPKTVHADIALILVTMIWGSTFTIVKQALAQVSPILFISLRFWVATVVIVALMPGALRNIPRETLRRGFILALLLICSFVFQTLGLQGTTPSKSAFITSLSLLLVPVLGFLLFHHQPRKQTLTGVAVATVGLGLLTLERLELNFTRGDTLTLICAVVFALHILFIARYTPLSDFRQLVVLQMGVGAVVSTVAIPILETPFLVWDVPFSLYLFVTGVLATAFGFYTQNRAQQFTTANRTALIFSLEPIFAALYSYLVLGQTLNIKEWFGGAMVIAGILTSEFRRD
jgi:drug/metabolite transporter (DMT)-like permease